ncbi:hypothetical protein [uncultured Paludibaculum sp.]|uniref:hypothetical protein n=1 Tax=uncultured Paludibaculum sp. TaxID=1765020 RepID=UPI002AABEE08|nr:hypothetical protein [uncultured Paludibaculum sp.]
MKRLAAEVSAQHGIRIDPDDPMMAVVTLNRLVFEQAVGQVLDRVQMAVRDFEVAADKVQVRAGSVLAQEVRDCSASFRDEIASTVEHLRSTGAARESVRCSDLRVPFVGWITFGLALSLALVSLGVWIGAVLR